MEQFKEIREQFIEEQDIAIKELIELTGITLHTEEKDTTPQEASSLLNGLGFSIHRFLEDTNKLQAFFVLAKGTEFIAGSVVEIDTKLNAIKRTMIPYDEKFDKLLKGMKG